MPVASLSCVNVGFCIRHKSHTVMQIASEKNHILGGASDFTSCDNVGMSDDKNAGPNFLRAWREYREMTQAELAEKVGTTQNMIGYLESGERGLSAKWLRRLAPALNTTPGYLLDHDPHELPSDIIDIWGAIAERERPRALRVLESFKTGTND